MAEQEHVSYQIVDRTLNLSDSSLDCCTNGANNPGCIIEKCGTVVDFNPSLNAYNDPATNGLVAGKYIDGSTIYAGQGDFTACWWQNPAPARIMSGGSSPGAYSSCYGALPAGENYDTKSPKYFLNHPDLKWVPTTAENALNIAGAVVIGGMRLGRKFMPSENGTYIQIGKISGGVFYYKIPGKTQEFTSYGDIDVLACVPCTNGGEGPCKLIFFLQKC